MFSVPIQVIKNQVRSVKYDFYLTEMLQKATGLQDYDT